MLSSLFIFHYLLECLLPLGNITWQKAQYSPAPLLLWFSRNAKCYKPPGDEDSFANMDEGFIWCLFT